MTEDEKRFRTLDKRYPALRRPVAPPIPYPGLYGVAGRSKRRWRRWRVVRRPIGGVKRDVLMIGNLWIFLMGVTHEFHGGDVAGSGLCFGMAVAFWGVWLALFRS